MPWGALRTTFSGKYLFCICGSSGAKKLLSIVGLAKRPNETPVERPKPLWVTSDSNERKQAQVQILRSNTRLKAILAGPSDPLMILGGGLLGKDPQSSRSEILPDVQAG